MVSTKNPPRAVGLELNRGWKIADKAPSPINPPFSILNPRSPTAKDWRVSSLPGAKTERLLRPCEKAEVV